MVVGGEGTHRKHELMPKVSDVWPHLVAGVVGESPVAWWEPPEITELDMPSDDPTSLSCTMTKGHTTVHRMNVHVTENGLVDTCEEEKWKACTVVGGP